MNDERGHDDRTTEGSGTPDEAPRSWRDRLMNARAAIAVGAAGLIIGASGGVALAAVAGDAGPGDRGGPGGGGPGFGSGPDGSGPDGGGPGGGGPGGGGPGFGSDGSPGGQWDRDGSSDGTDGRPAPGSSGQTSGQNT